MSLLQSKGQRCIILSVPLLVKIIRWWSFTCLETNEPTWWWCCNNVTIGFYVFCSIVHRYCNYVFLYRANFFLNRPKWLSHEKNLLQGVKAAAGVEAWRVLRTPTTKSTEYRRAFVCCPAAALSLHGVCRQQDAGRRRQQVFRCRVALTSRRFLKRFFKFSRITDIYLLAIWLMTFVYVCVVWMTLWSSRVDFCV